MSMGAAAGVGASFWAQYRLRRTLDEHATARVSLQAVVKARRLGVEVREAILDGRETMVAREEALRSELDARLVPIRPQAGPDVVTRASSRRRRRGGDPSGSAPLGSDGVRAGADGTRLRVVDAPSERVEPAERRVDRALVRHPSTAGHPSLGSGSRIEHVTDRDPPAAVVPRRGAWRRRR
jgi:hypothetical protein